MLGTHSFTRSAFWLKVGLAALLGGLAQFLFIGGLPWGAVVGGFAAAWLLAVVAARPGLRRDPRALIALLAACGLALLMIERPGLLAWLLFGLMLTVAVLSARVKAGEPVWRWWQRLVVHAVVSVAGPFIDLHRLTRRRRRPRLHRQSPLTLIRALALPVIGGLVFLTLFARANPLIDEALHAVHVTGPSGEMIGRGVFALFVALATGALLRPRWRRKLMALPSLGQRALPGVSTASVILSLIVFNALFALQNGLDIAFLWSGAPLPGEMTLADYAHRGAYPLIATALLAGLFVLVALRPGSETARRPLVRRLVVLWVGQNMVLVASALLRTADYVEGYALTRFRIAAMIWMVLVGVGLLLICWRLLKGKDGHWLIDANVKLALIVLAAVSVVDLGAIAARWNVRHAREIDGTGAVLDLGYMRSLGAPALVSLVELERTTTDADLKDRAAAVRTDIHRTLRRQQADWRSWTWRGARRLAKVEAMAAERPLVTPKPGDRTWEGEILSRPPPPAPEAPAPSLLPPQETAPTPLTSASGV
ncbi:DUF4173 domain-containing protein [Brevundimonas sp. GCM10030266]|uniref:DUF4153 domain-containing protein n=1 Tax=Brevundimonas sp. GCM10030266 TaxID=3273386 RepID=UPI0036132B91